MATELKTLIEQANALALDRLVRAEPVLVDIAPAGEVIPGLDDHMILHAGPPVAWDTMSGAQRGAMIGMVLFEGWAETPEEAQAMLERGEIRFQPNHHHQAVGPMAGTISPHMWVFVVENRAFGNRAFCRQIEGRQQFGEYRPQALEDLARWRDVWGPTLREGLRVLGELALKPLITRALQMGDELHNRPNAASSLFANALSVGLVEADVEREPLVSTLRYVTGHEFFFLGLSMAAAKASIDPCRGIPYSTMVTAMARNGTEFGIQVSGLDGEWFTAGAPAIRGLFVPGYREADAGLDIGDSSITETVGWGGFVLAGATGILALVGGAPEEAFAFSREMRQITIGQSPDYRIPTLDFEGTAIGIDIRKVVQTGILPIIDTAIAHREPGHPIIGAGLVRPPLECFKRALMRFGETYAGEKVV